MPRAAECVCVSVSSKSAFFSQTNRAIKKESVSVMERVQKPPEQNCFIVTLMQRRLALMLTSGLSLS